MRDDTFQFATTRLLSQQIARELTADWQERLRAAQAAEPSQIRTYILDRNRNGDLTDDLVKVWAPAAQQGMPREIVDTIRLDGREVRYHLVDMALPARWLAIRRLDGIKGSIMVGGKTYGLISWETSLLGGPPIVRFCIDLDGDGAMNTADGSRELFCGDSVVDLGPCSFVIQEWTK
ncbi:MAG: hypothetical protein GF331_15760, partial [Chitinivibrionales bacterium]|nr:hypothetical protein [Chitinivibrionales bacterium]